MNETVFERWNSFKIIFAFKIVLFVNRRLKNDDDRINVIRRWYNEGGVLVLGYEMFRNLSQKSEFRENLLDPGPDVVVCDEGHILKNDESLINNSVNSIRTLRRIVLTGTPLQNNLSEYYCMIQFVKPNLLGNKKEYANQFINPIKNGQYYDSTWEDIALMKRRSYILHSLVDGFVQRKNESVLDQYLPRKEEYTIFIRLSQLQNDLYTV